MRAGKKRHRVDVMLPAAGEGSRGERTGQPTTVLSSVPCSIVTLSGRELSQARQIYAAATYRVEMLADPNQPITENHYLLFGARRLHIGFADDVDQRGYEYHLLCAESR